MQVRHVLGKRPLVAPQQRCRSWPRLRSPGCPGVATNITPLLTIGGAWWPSTWPVAKLQTSCRRPTLARRDLRQRTVAPAVIGAAEHQPIAVLGLLQPLGCRPAYTSDSMSGIGPGTGVADAGATVLTVCCADAADDAGCREQRSQAHVSHEHLGIDHDVSSLVVTDSLGVRSDLTLRLTAISSWRRLLACQARDDADAADERLGHRRACRPRSSSGSAASARGVGPSMTAAASRGL